MKRVIRSENERAARLGHLSRELWSNRPLSYHSKTAENKRLSMKLWRRRLKRELCKEMTEI